MAKSDISVKLGLDSKEFDDNIKNSKKQINKFKKDTQSTQSQIANSFSGMIKGAGAFGLALVGVNGVSSAFQKLLDSNQKFGDDFDATMGGCKNVFNDFVRYLGDADLSSFSANIKNAYIAGIEEAKAYDQLGNTKMSYGVVSKERFAQIGDIEAKLSKETDPLKIKELKAEREALIKELKGLSGTLGADIINALNSGANAAIGGILSGGIKNIFTEDMFLKSAEVDLDQNGRDKSKADAEAFYKGLSKKINPFITKIDKLQSIIDNRYTSEATKHMSKEDGDTYMAGVQAEIDGYKKGMSELTSSLSQEERQHLLNYITLFRYSDDKLQGVFNELSSLFDAKRYISKLEKKEVKTGVVSGSGSKSKEEKDENKWYNDNGRLKIEPDFDTAKFRYKAEQALSNEMKPIKVPIELPNVENITKAIAPKEIENIDVNDQINQFTNLASAISNVTGAVNEGASGWISWGASLLTAIATAIPAITALTAAKKAEANANAEAAVTGAASSVAGIPMVGWLLAGAAVASVVAAMISVPKFATGGIVGGGSYSGDKIPSLLNAGEMVLNTRQQANLFNQLDRGQSGNSVVSNQVEFKIKGDYLVGMLNKTSKQKSRV